MLPIQQGMVELWMYEVAESMKDALINTICLALNEWTWRPDLDYLAKYPGQSIYCAFLISWTRTVEEHIQSTKKWTVRSFITASKDSSLSFG